MYIYIYMYTYDIRVYVCMDGWMHVCVCMYVCMCRYVCVCTHVCMYVSLTHSLSPYRLEVALAARLIIGLCPFPRAFPAAVCTQKIGTVVPQLAPIPIST